MNAIAEAERVSLPDENLTPISEYEKASKRCCDG